MKKYLICLILLIILIGCGNEPPIINYPNYNILIYEGGSLNIPSNMMFLSVYFVLQDDNGIEDINSIRVIHTETEYSWDLPLDIINKTTIWQERTYVGCPFLEYNDGRSLLTGEYVIEIEDKAGNYADISFFVEIEGLILMKPYEIPEIKYKAKVLNDNKELSISGARYSSCEIRYLSDLSFFNGGRKKIKSGNKIILNNNNEMPVGTKISVRVNSDDDEKIIYFLKTLTIQ